MSKVELILKNPATEKFRTAPLGFSWTVLFFGFLVPLFRRDWKYTFIFLLLYILSLGCLSPVMACLYNRSYARRMLASGYRLFYIRGNLKSDTLEKLTAQ